MKNLLVTLADKNYVEQAKQLFSSAYFNAGWQEDFMLLAHQIPEKDLKWFKDKGILVFDCPEIKIKNKMHGKWPDVVLDKFYLFTPYFKKWKNIIFLDADIIIRKSLKNLCNIEGFGAVLSHNNLSKLFFKKTYMYLAGVDNKPYKEIKLKENFNRRVFNSGVFAFSTDLIKDNTFSNLLALQEKYGHLCTAGEELAFNLHFKNWISLPFIYNIHPDYILATSFVKPTDIKGVILHFVLKKPWNKEHFFYKEWKENLALADSIGVIKQKKINSFKEDDVRKYSLFLEREIRKGLLKRVVYEIFVYADRLIGLLGLFIKRFLPKLYFYFKMKIKTK